MKTIQLFSLSLLLINQLANADMHAFSQQKAPPNLLNDGKLHIYFCGTGDPEVDMQSIRKPSCLAVVGDNQIVMIDVGEGGSQNLGALGLPLGSIHHVFATHWHSDHMAGIGYLNNASWLGGRSTPLMLHGPFGVKKIAKAINDSYSLDVLYRSINRNGLFDMKKSLIKPILVSPPYKGEGKPVLQSKSYTLSPFRVDHNPVYPALGYVIKYQSCKIVISGDTKVMDNLATVSQNADLLINEAFSHYFGQLIQKTNSTLPNPERHELFYKQTAQYHSDTLALAKMAADSNVKNLFLTHTVPAIPTTKSAKDAFITGMDKYYSRPITIADDRDEIIISTENGGCKVEYKPGVQYPFKTVQNIN